MNIQADEHFDLKDIMECGQAFRYKRLESGGYAIIAHGKRLIAKQKGHRLTLDCSEKDWAEVWRGYFDVDRDYGRVKEELTAMEPRLAPYISKKPGIRILKQEPFEMLITFILSQNKSMVHIKQLVAIISEAYGSEIGEGGHAFPLPEQLARVSEESFRELKTGFRAPYLVDAIHRVVTGQLDLESLTMLSADKAREELLAVKGIGRKVADCILLFGYGKMDVFPLDVWMKRAMTKLYFDGKKPSDKAMLAKAREKFGDLQGIAQQYLFYGTVEGL